jgi:hypothetical protein
MSIAGIQVLHANPHVYRVHASHIDISKYDAARGLFFIDADELNSTDSVVLSAASDPLRACVCTSFLGRV